MQKITKATGVLVAVGILLAAAVSPAMAADAGSSAVDSSVTGGDLSATTAGATLSGVTLDGSNTQTATGPSTTAWRIIDARGTGAAWALSASASDFTSAIGTGTDPVDTVVRTIAATNLTITPGTITASAGADTAPTTSAVVIEAADTAQALVSATGPAKGTYTLTPTFSLAIPANAFRSNYATTVVAGDLNPYISTITYTIA